MAGSGPPSNPMPWWNVPPDWAGETAFIVAGGHSVTAYTDDDGALSCIKGRKVIAVNSSVLQRAPFADLLFFGDNRWWSHNLAKLKCFTGNIATTASINDERLRKLAKVRPPPGLSDKPHEAVMRRTSLQAAINIAAHRAVKRIVLIGADMDRGPEGQCHHHEPHPWPPKPGCWDAQMAELKLTAPLLKAKGIEVLNASLASRIDWWPKVKLEDVL